MLHLQEYIRRMASALLDVDGQEQSDPVAVEAMQQIAMEYGEFACALVNFNLDAARALYTGNLSEDENAPTSMSEDQYHMLVVSTIKAYLQHAPNKHKVSIYLLIQCVHSLVMCINALCVFCDGCSILVYLLELSMCHGRMHHLAGDVCVTCLGALCSSHHLPPNTVNLM